MSIFTQINKKVGVAMLLVASNLLSGCIVGDSITAYTLDEPFEYDPVDPYEKSNRLVYAFNSELDQWIVYPISDTYREVVPSPVQSCIGNFFDNLKEPARIVGNALLLDRHAVVNNYSRFVTNTFLGGAGCFDAASSMKIEPKNVDLGLVVRRYNLVKDPPYLVLPLLGPTTITDGALALTEDNYLSPVHGTYWYGRKPKDSRWFNPYVTDKNRTLNQLTIVRGIHTRAELIDASDLLETAALDPYSFLRDAYLERRETLAAQLRDR